jgi:hypothetical protein
MRGPAASLAVGCDDVTLRIPVESLERVEAPAPGAFVARYLRPRRPVVLTGLTSEWLAPERWTLERMAARYGEAHVVAAALANGTLLDDPERGVVFQRIPLGDVVRSFADAAAPAHYVMAPTGNLPAAFADDYRVPPY